MCLTKTYNSYLTTQSEISQGTSRCPILSYRPQMIKSQYITNENVPDILEYYFHYSIGWEDMTYQKGNFIYE